MHGKDGTTLRHAFCLETCHAVSVTKEKAEDSWEQHAEWWQEGFTEGADEEYEEQIIPLARDLLTGYKKILDVGTGEGQISRVLVESGAETVIGVDPTHNQILEANRRGGGPVYLRGKSEQLPFNESSFDAAIACLVFEHIEAMDSAIEEIARILKPNAKFLFFLNHPLVQTPGSGWIDDQILDPPEKYWRIGPYLTEVMEMEEVDNGVFLPFVHRPLSRYVNALSSAGLVISSMHEPSPPEGFLKRSLQFGDAALIPRLLLIEAVRVA